MSASHPVAVAAGAEIVYGRRPVAEAKRGRRRVRRLWTTREKTTSELTRLAGSPDHQGVVAEVDPYPYADPGSLLARPDALVVALDQVQDPRNLGAVCRSAEAVGAADDEFASARRESFREGLADDFNTPRALAALFELISEGNRRPLPGARAALEEMLPLLGLEPLLAPAEGPDPDARRLMDEREEARAARDFERADRIRDELAARGYEVRDTPSGPLLVKRG